MDTTQLGSTSSRDVDGTSVEMDLDDTACPNCAGDSNLAYDGLLECGTSIKQLAQFALVKVIGSGAFGFVWKAVDNKLDRVVAVKVPRHRLSPADKERFYREARSAAQLRHPNIVGVHEVGQDGDTPYLVTDFIDGVHLMEWLSKGLPSFRKIADLVAKLADALHCAHTRGVVHRDVKPSNVIMDVQGEPHLTDFGLAKRDIGEVTVTMPGHLLGTPAYMSPEQAKGNAHLADARSDIYSLGVVLFLMLTGEPPFRGDSRTILHRILADEPPRPRKLNRSVPRDLETICLKCLEKKPVSRYTSSDQLAHDLKCFLRGEPISARPPGILSRLVKWSRRRPSVAALTIITVALLVTIMIGAVTIAWKQSLDRQRAVIATQVAVGEALQESRRRQQAETEKRDAIILATKESRRRQLAEEDTEKVVRLLASVGSRIWELRNSADANEQKIKMLEYQVLPENQKTLRNAVDIFYSDVEGELPDLRPPGTDDLDEIVKRTFEEGHPVRLAWEKYTEPWPFPGASFVTNGADSGDSQDQTGDDGANTSSRVDMDPPVKARAGTLD